MNNISNSGKWFLKLFFLFLSFLFAVIIIFLLRPEYFIEDIEKFIKDQLSSSLNGKVNIGNINGNFVEGFRLNQVLYQEDSLIIFSAQEIYIDPDLSRIFSGNITLSELVIRNSYFNYDNQKLESYNSFDQSTLLNWSFSISSLLIKKSLFV